MYQRLNPYLHHLWLLFMLSGPAVASQSNSAQGHSVTPAYVPVDESRRTDLTLAGSPTADPTATSLTFWFRFWPRFFLQIFPRWLLTDGEHEQISTPYGELLRGSDY